MKHQKTIASVAVVVLVVAVGLGIYHSKHHSKALTPMTLALDWTPNTNHTGIYVALHNGWYKKQGIDLKLLPYSDGASSDSLVAAGKADVGVSFTEAVVADAASDSPVVSIAAIVQHDTSIIMVRKDSGITRPKQLEGKIYGGYGAPYEQPVMSQVIKHDGGGDGDFKNVTVSTDALTALQSKQVDFIWVFQGWEGFEAPRQGLSVKTFSPTDFGIPDYSTPDLITSPATLQKKHDLLKRFMTATSRGYEYARNNPQSAANILIESAPKGTFSDTTLVKESQAYLSTHYQDAHREWGMQTPDLWTKYPEFMLSHKAVLKTDGSPVKTLDFDKLYTNELL